MRRLLTLLPILLLTAPAVAQERPFCADRPGLNTSPCTMSLGRAQAEVGAANLTRDKVDGERTDTLLIGRPVVRIGLTDSLEAQVGWTAYSRVTTRFAGARDRTSSTGEVLLSARQNLRNPDGSALSYAVMGTVVLPTGGGDKRTSFRLLAPLALPLVGEFGFAATPEVDLVPDSPSTANGSARGRHAVFGSVAGVSRSIGPIGVAAELSVFRDTDPGATSTQTLAALSAAWQPADDWQLDLGTAVGLNRSTPDSQVYFGVSRRF